MEPTTTASAVGEQRSIFVEFHTKTENCCAIATLPSDADIHQTPPDSHSDNMCASVLDCLLWILDSHSFLSCSKMMEDTLWDINRKTSGKQGSLRSKKLDCWLQSPSYGNKRYYEIDSDKMQFILNLSSVAISLTEGWSLASASKADLIFLKFRGWVFWGYEPSHTEPFLMVWLVVCSFLVTFKLILKDEYSMFKVHLLTVSGSRVIT